MIETVVFGPDGVPIDEGPSRSRCANKVSYVLLVAKSHRAATAAGTLRAGTPAATLVMAN